jgi:hypothetical protein
MPLSRCLAMLLATLVLASAGPAAAVRWGAPEYAGLLTDPELSELSGLAASRTQPGKFWIINDGGNGESLLLIEPTGTRVATVAVTGVVNTDWEDLASFVLDGRNYVLIADTGDNGGIRKSLKLHVIEEPANPKDGDRIAPAWTIEFDWPDGARDCEAVAVDAARGEVLLVSKKRVPPELFRVALRPAAGVVQVAERIGTLAGIVQPREQELRQNPVYGRYRSQVSGADLSPNGRVLAVLNYTRIYFFVRPGGGAWEQAQLERAGALDFPWLPQAEAIAFSADGGSLLIGGEQRPSPLICFGIRRRGEPDPPPPDDTDVPPAKKGACNLISQ